MTFACTDCSRCGKCYEKNSVCPACGGPIYLLDDACPACEEPITQGMRDSARRAYKLKKKEEKKDIMKLAAEARRRREHEAESKPRVKYPWE